MRLLFALALVACRAATPTSDPCDACTHLAACLPTCHDACANARANGVHFPTDCVATATCDTARACR